jgi:hypothetical protein
MKFYISLFILIFTMLPARADYITTNTFVIDAQHTVTIIISGNLNSTINGDTGTLTSALSINFNIATNADLCNIGLRANVVNSSASNQSAFYSTCSDAASSQNMNLVLADYDHPPDAASIEDCKQATSTPESNPDSIAYPGTVTIDNAGTISYQDNNSNGYFLCQVLQGTTNLTIALNTVPKSGTYDSTTAMDEPDTFKAEIYLDSLP